MVIIVLNTLGLTTDPTPNDFTFYSPYPNPFNTTTTIRFNIPVETRHPSIPLGNHAVSIQIIDITGHKVETMMNETVEAGKHEIKWNASPYASGIYFAVLQSGKKSVSEKIIYIK